MPRPYREDVRALSKQYPFGVVLPFPDKFVVLIPAQWSKSDYHAVRLVEESIVRKALSGFRADFTAVAGMRRLLADNTSLANSASLLDGNRVVEAATAAIVAGHIYAVIAEIPVDPADNPAIDYNGLAARYRSTSGAASEAGFFTFLLQQLPGLCCDAYDLMAGAGGEIVQLTDHGYEFLFDLGAERVVAAFGITQYNPGRRDSDRMGDFLGQVTSKAELQRIASRAGSARAGRERVEKARLTWRDRFFQTHGHQYDRGHFMSHRQGGGLDVNLFPQRADINQGRGALGAEYRAMETACVARPGVAPVFCCSRPLYDDGSWVPAKLEYAVIYNPNRINARTFPNK
jgi:hypothetical protein